MNTRSLAPLPEGSLTGFTILETVLATILATLLIIGTAAVFQNMQNQTSAFKTSVDKDMRWVEANRHLVESVHASSFLNILPDPTRPNQSTLELHNYGGDKKGTYTNDNTGLSYQDATSGAITTFPGVNATFTAPSTGSTTGKGWKNNKLIEAIINYSAPFTSTLRLRCAVSVKGASTWAVTVKFGEFVDMIKTSDGQYAVLLYAPSQDAAGDTVLLKIDGNGKVTLVRRYGWTNSRPNERGMTMSTIRETFDAVGHSDGYILCGTVYFIVGRYRHDGVLVRLNPSGDVIWANEYNRDPADPAMNTGYTYGYSAHQVFSKYGGTPSGFIVTGNAYLHSDPSDDTTGALLWRCDNDGNVSWARAYSSYDPSIPTGWNINGSPDYFESAQQVFTASGASNGFIVTGLGAGGEVNSNTFAYIVKTDDSGAHVWSKLFGRGTGIWYSDTDVAYDVLPLYDKGTPAGFLTVGTIHESAMNSKDSTHFVMELGTDGSYQWSNALNHTYYSYFLVKKQAWVSSGNFKTLFHTFNADNLHDISVVTIGPTGNTLATVPIDKVPNCFFFKAFDSTDVSGSFNGYVLGGEKAEMSNSVFIMYCDQNGKHGATQQIETVIVNDLAAQQVVFNNNFSLPFVKTFTDPRPPDPNSENTGIDPGSP